MAENTAYRVIVSDRARRMLGERLRFLAKVSRDAAAAQRDTIIAALRSLEAMPQRYPFFEEQYIPPNKYHKMFVARRYIVLYQIQDFTVYVDYILDCRRDYRWLMR